MCALFPITWLHMGFKRLCGERGGGGFGMTVMDRWRHAQEEALWSSKEKSAETPGQGAKES